MRILALLALFAVALGAPAMAQGTWSIPVEVKAVNSTSTDYYPHISGDSKTLRVSSARADLPGRVGGYDVNFATRTNRHSPWGAMQVEPGTINSTTNDVSPHVLSDELTCYLANSLPGTGGHDIWCVSRNSPSAPWGNAIEIASVNTTSTEYGVSVTDDELYMALWSSNGYFVESVRASITQPWPTPTPVAELNIGSPASGKDTRVSTDGLTMYFCPSGAPGSVGGNDIYVARRTFRTDRWGTPTIVPNVNSTGTDRVPSISPDGRELYFSSSRTGGTGGQDIWVSYFTGLSYQNLPQIASPLLLHVTDAGKPGEGYQIGLSLSNNIGIRIPNVGTVPLDLDNLLILSVQNLVPGFFMNFAGILDKYGEATGQLNIPASIGLVGVPFHAAAVLYNPQGISYITNGLTLGIHR